MPTHPIYTNQISSYPAASRKRWKSSPLEQKKTSKSLGSPTKNPNHHMPETPFFCCVFVFVSMASNKFIPPPHPPQKKTHNKNHQCCHVLCLNMYIYIYYIYIHIFKTKKASEIFPPPPPKSEKSPQRRSIVVRKLDVGDRPPSPTNLQPHPLPPGGLENLDGCMFRSLNAVKECISGQNCKISPTAD